MPSGAPSGSLNTGCRRCGSSRRTRRVRRCGASARSSGANPQTSAFKNLGEVAFSGHPFGAIPHVIGAVFQLGMPVLSGGRVAPTCEKRCHHCKFISGPSVASRSGCRTLRSTTEAMIEYRLHHGLGSPLARPPRPSFAFARIRRC
jgi:hypothetical protein